MRNSDISYIQAKQIGIESILHSKRATIRRRVGEGGIVEIRVSLVGGDRADGLESLDDWLRGEPRLAGRVKVAVPRPREGELGALGDALVVAAGSGGALSVLATSLHAWLAQPRRSDVLIRVQGGNGRVVEIAADRVDAAQTAVLLHEALDYGPPEG
jgi:Effector Associated Constant Component 1